MKLQKKLIIISAIVMILLIICNIVIFKVPLRKSPVFWISDAFAVFSLLFLLYTYKIGFKNADGTRSKVYGIPILRIGFVYVIANMICAIALILLSAFLPKFQVWIAVLVYILLFGLAVIGVFAAVNTRNYVEKATSSTEFMRQFRLDILELMGEADDETLAHVLRDIVEIIKNSDSVSCSATAEVEDKLAAEVVLLKAAFKDSDTEDAMELCKKLKKDLDIRNKLCKTGSNGGNE